MIRMPNNQQRILIAGKTGTGKTCGAVWHLSQKDFTKDIWIVLNHKGDDLIDSVEGAVFLDIDERPDLNKAGLYIYHPLPDIDDQAVTDLLWWIHRHGNMGLYVDEGYMINARDPALQAILTQGRSKRIPLIFLSQRIAWISRFCVSEADFFMLYFLTDKRDRQTVNSFIPVNLDNLMEAPVNSEPALKKYHSLYYDVGANKAVILEPVPTGDEILKRFNIEKQKNVRTL